jgi:hypothetical protein
MHSFTEIRSEAVQAALADYSAKQHPNALQPVKRPTNEATDKQQKSSRRLKGNKKFTVSGCKFNILLLFKSTNFVYRFKLGR